ncbi:uncharacterized protein [Typha latifolia]|uniref:uncharacterized protein n=1 Tax=Typha latifolia TaxID=4733 RepID=UPI003C302841
MMEDLLNADLGKHDYDWLLTPPATPRVPSLDVAENPLSSAIPKRTTTRSSSTTRASRLSISQPENGHSSRPARSSSVSRPSISSSFISSNNRTSILNTSSVSVSSRPSTPSRRTGTPLTARPSTPASRPMPTRPSTPVKNRPAPPSSTGVKTGPTQNSRPSTPTSRPRIISTSISSSNSVVTRCSSRPSTPTRQPITPAPAPVIGRSPSVGRTPVASSLTSIGRTPATNGRNSAPSSRPSSPSPRPRVPVQPLDVPDFPNNTPPNLRTKLPERPISAGRTRPGMALIARATHNSEPVAPNSNKRLSLPIVARSKFPENMSNMSKATSLSNGHQAKPAATPKPTVSEAEGWRTAKSATATESGGFGRTISKSSLDMALMHMDIRQNMGGIRGASLFPHSIRSAAAKGRPARMSDPGVTATNDNEFFPENGNNAGRISDRYNGDISRNTDSLFNESPIRGSLVTKDTFSEIDTYGSYRYDAMFLREDLNNTNWLHSVDDKSDLGSLFDNRFEPLPEPFGPL